MVQRLGVLTMILATLVLTACGQSEWVPETAPAPVLGPYASSESTSSDGRAVVVMVALAEDGERGDLPALLQQSKDLARGLSSSLATLVQPFWEGDEESQMAVLSYVVVGAAQEDGEVWLFARKDFMTYAVSGGRLVEVSGDAAPVRIRTSGDFKVIAVDEPSDADMDEESLTDYMPSWALVRTQYDGDLQALEDGAWRWAKGTGRLPELVLQTRPDHEDPHSHSPGVYTLGVLPAAVNGFIIESTNPPELVEGEPDPEDYEQVTSSPDSRFVCYLGDGILLHDVQSNTWLQLDGPNLYGQGQEYSWVGDVLVFDVFDMGFSEPTPERMTGIHVEVNLDTIQVERVVPIGSYTLNSRKD
jgi:hypothetical protein